MSVAHIGAGPDRTAEIAAKVEAFVREVVVPMNAIPAATITTARPRSINGAWPRRSSATGARARGSSDMSVDASVNAGTTAVR
ncbi:hypothetical protein NUH86_19660 [Sphingobium sp. JS3065]|uniref:hypothetical protein n=1 Tax=Sphingobium sp. JS3065 TaxID=2970925 RepID=UPI002264CD78|nr:hypothetical protein [Sphingobium sp. JS3065]UZW57782.1 hypothetical protein NUH86_19660 [Sphingobium sp. JS3065]